MAGLNKLEGLLGAIVFDREAPFLMERELSFHTGQLPQFLPRQHFPKDPDLGAKFRAGLDTNIDWDNPQETEALADMVRQAYPQLEPMAPFVEGTYDAEKWEYHVASVHRIYSKISSPGHVLKHSEMHALLRIVSYGMFGYMTFLPGWMIDGLNDTRQTRQDDPRAASEASKRYATELSILMRPGSFLHDSDVDQTHYQKRISGKRWVVVPIRHGAAHWTMTMFDRELGQLYICDTGEPVDRVNRIEAALQLWARFWNWMGLPFHIRYYAPAVSEQKSELDSGLISIMWVMRNLRNMSGDRMRPMDMSDSVPRQDLLIMGRQGAVEISRSQLPLQDWVHEGCTRITAAMKGVRYIIRAVCCNELGLSNDKFFTKSYTNPKGHQSPYDRIQAATHHYKKEENGLCIPFHDFWTGEGGPQFAIPEGAVVADYNEHRDREHYRPATMVRSFEIIKTEPVDLNYTFVAAGAPLRWPPGPVYTDARPVPHFHDGVELMVNTVDSVDHPNPRTCRYEIHLDNALAQPAHQALRNAVDLEIAGPVIVRRDNGEWALTWNLFIGCQGQNPRVATYTVPLGPLISDVEAAMSDDVEVKDDEMDLL